MAGQKSKSDSNDTSSQVHPTCFVMMPIADTEGYRPGHFGEVYTQLIEPAVNEAGYDCELATSTSSAHMIHLEVVTKVATADLCICDLSTNNPNVLFEYGIRQAFDKPTVLIKDDQTPRIFDVSIFRDIEYDHTLRISNVLAKRAAIVKAIKQTVKGSSDDSQVFSLVKLMNLTRAALPTGEVNRDDARFALLERKLDNIAAQFSDRRLFAGTSFASPNIGRPFQEVGDSVFDFEDCQLTVGRPGLLYTDKKSGQSHVYNTLSDFEREPWWAFLDPVRKRNVLSTLGQRADHFIPF